MIQKDVDNQCVIMGAFLSESQTDLEITEEEISELYLGLLSHIMIQINIANQRVIAESQIDLEYIVEYPSCSHKSMAVVLKMLSTN